ncbi:uncharacterized protein LOC144123122 [Amblyomma americanum]
MSDKAPSTIKELAKALNELSALFDAKHVELKDTVKTVIETELQSLKESMSLINEKFEGFRSEMVEMRKELAVTKAENEAIRSTNAHLTSELKKVRRELTDMQQYSRRNNLEIKGVPVVADENLISTMKTISGCLNTEVVESDIEVIHRVPTKKKDEQNIIVKFFSRTVRDKILKVAKKQRLNVSQLGFEGNTPVFVNEHLCPANKVLLGMAVKAKKEKKWKFTWVSDGKILMRKVENSHVLHVTSAEDLRQVL